MSKNNVNMGIPSLSTEKISEMVVLAYNNKRPLLLYGSPGCGKSQGVIAGGVKLGKNLKIPVLVNPSNEDEIMQFGIYLRLMSMFAPEDVGGLPYTTDINGSKVVKFAKTGVFPTSEGTKGLIFLDEIGNAEEYKFGPLQSVITERRIGSYTIPDGIQFVLATNKPEDGTGARELPSAIRNRCMQFDVIAPTGETFIEMMRKIDRKLHKYVEGFLLTFPSETYTFTPEKVASATLRSWENISDSLKNTKDLSEEVLIVGSLVGTEISSKYKAWRKMSEKIKLSDIIKNPVLVKDYEHDKGMLYNIALGLLDHAEKTKNNINDVFNVMLEITHDEFSIYLIKNLLELHKNNVISAEISKAPNNKEINAKLEQYIEYFMD